MRAYEQFCGLRIVTFCVLDNHFHILVEVPRRPEPADLPTDEELVRLVEVADCNYGSIELARLLGQLRQSGDLAAAEALRGQFFAHMWDVSAFLQTLKQRFTQWPGSLLHRHSLGGAL
jgi:putative transposase